MRFVLAYILLLCNLFALSQTKAPSEILTNNSIIELQKAGLSKEIIRTKILASKCDFDITTEALIGLKKNNVPNEIITIMMSMDNTKTSSNSPTINKIAPNSLNVGVYYFDSLANVFTEMDPSILANQKAGDIGESVLRGVSGYFNSKIRSSLFGANAKLIFKNTPSFTFVFDTTKKGFNNNTWNTIQSPNEFFLVKFIVVNKSREIVIGKQNKVGYDVGIDDKAKIAFEYKKIKNGMYEVSPLKPLKKGEYCFTLSISSIYQAANYKVYDFSVK
jgi:hypothetical protein